MEPKRYYRNPSTRMIGGVCSGLGDYFDVDPTLVRLVFVLMTLAGGAGILLYLVLLIVTPEKPYVFAQSNNQTSETMENQQTPQENQNDPYKNNRHYNHNKGNLIGGLVLITLGALFLADELIPHISFGDLWPLILVVIGIGLLINSLAGKRRKN